MCSVLAIALSPVSSSTSALCNRLTPPLKLEFGHVYMMCFTVCSSPHAQREDSIIPHLYKRLLHRPCSVLAIFRVVHIIRERSNRELLAWNRRSICRFVLWTLISGFSIPLTWILSEFLGPIWDAFLWVWCNGKLELLLNFFNNNYCSIGLRRSDGIIFASTGNHCTWVVLTLPEIIPRYLGHYSLGIDVSLIFIFKFLFASRLVCQMAWTSILCF